MQDYAASKLITYLEPRQFNEILDIGCGTGNYTLLLRNKFPSSVIKAMDISAGMIKVAQQKLESKKIDFLVADAESTDLTGSFDLITSNTCFQWFTNLNKTIIKYKNLLNEDGTMLFSMFGPLTFLELNESMEQLFKEDVSISSTSFLDKTAICDILKKHFGQSIVVEKTIRNTFPSLWELMNRIKYSGSRGFGLNNKKLSRYKIADLEKIYRRKFGDITTTYQIFFCRATQNTSF